MDNGNGWENMPPEGGGAANTGHWGSVSLEAAVLDNFVTTAGRKLKARGFDLLSVPGASEMAREVQEQWKTIADLPGAERFERVPDLNFEPGEEQEERAQRIANAVLRGTAFKAQVTVGDGGNVTIAISENGERRGSADISPSAGMGHSGYVHFNTSAFKKGSGAGGAFYTAAHAIANRFGWPTEADPSGLSAVNTRRRTGVMMAMFLRGDLDRDSVPGAGQRVWGWQKGGIQSENFTRLALADMRNVGEIVPEFQPGDIEYDIAGDRFMRDGKDIEPLIAQILRRPARNDWSLSRSALARAALTAQIMSGQRPAEGVERAAAPMLLSRRQGEGAAPVTKTAAFQRWFGASKIVNQDGSPMVMYHGTAADFDRFELGRGPTEARAVFVTSNAEFANRFSEYSRSVDPNTAPNVIPLYVRAENPFDFRDKEQVSTLVKEVMREWGLAEVDGEVVNAKRLTALVAPERGTDANWIAMEAAPVQRALKKLGHDGWWFREDGAVHLGVFSPSQVKSATGNSGAFSREDERITASARQAPARAYNGARSPAEDTEAVKVKRAEVIALRKRIAVLKSLRACLAG
jgi:hypothetical protein